MHLVPFLLQGVVRTRYSFRTTAEKDVGYQSVEQGSSFILLISQKVPYIPHRLFRHLLSSAFTIYGFAANLLSYFELVWLVEVV